MKELSNQEIIEALKLKAEENERKAEEYKRSAKSYREAIQSLETTIGTESLSNDTIPKLVRTKWPKGMTYEDHIINIFRNGIPHTAKELHQGIEERMKKKINYATFSGRLSQIVKGGGNIKIHRFLNNPLSTRFYYGLKDWFIEENLKDEYLNRIKNGDKKKSGLSEIKLPSL